MIYDYIKKMSVKIKILLTKVMKEITLVYLKIIDFSTSLF